LEEVRKPAKVERYLENPVEPELDLVRPPLARQTQKQLASCWKERPIVERIFASLSFAPASAGGARLKQQMPQNKWPSITG
jgi:hypothetical protein